MSATIKIAVDDKQAEEALKRLSSEIKKTGAAADITSDQLEGVAKEMDARKAAAFNDEVKRIADELERASPAAKRARADFAAFNTEVIQQSAELRKLNAAAYDAAKQAGTLGTYIKDLNAAMDAKRTANYRREIDALADATVNGKKRVEGFSNAWTEFGSQVQLVKQAFQVLGQAGRAAEQVISHMAEKGVTAFKEFTDAQKEFVDSLEEVAATPGVQKLISGLAGGVRRFGDDVSWATDKAVTFGHKASDATFEAIVRMQELKAAVGLGGDEYAKAARKGIEAMRALAKEQRSQVLWENEQRESRAAFAEKQAALSKEQVRNNLLNPLGAGSRDRSMRKEVDSLLTPEQALSEQTRLAEQHRKLVQGILEKGGENGESQAAANQQVQDSAAKLRAIEQKRLELIREQVIAEEDLKKLEGERTFQAESLRLAKQELELSQKNRDAFEATKKALGEEVREFAKFKDLQEQVNRAEQKYLDTLQGPIKAEEETRLRRANALRELELQIADDKLKAIQEESQAKQQAFDLEKQKMKEQAANFQQFLQAKQQAAGGGGQPGIGGFGGGKGGVQQLTPQQFMFLQKAREQAALKEFNENQKGAKFFKQNSKGEVIGAKSGNQVLLNKRDRESQQKRNEARIRADARKGFRRDAAKGKIGYPEVGQAQNAAQDAILKKIEAQGGVTTEQLNWYREMTKNSIQQTNQLNSFEQALFNFQQALQAIANGKPPPAGINNKKTANMMGNAGN